MKPCIKFLSIIILPVLSMANYAEDATPPALVIEARETIVTFQKALKKELQGAMRSGGPEKAIEVCHERAPEIAKAIGQQTGWTIGRTSLKTRNPLNVPNDRERDILEQFSVRQAKGEALNTLDWWKIDKNEMAYMKAIPTKNLCTRCHGTDIDPSLQQKIVHFYPDDKATGFNTGEIRGAFTLKKTLGQYDGKTSK